MNEKMRVMSQKPLNAETPAPYLRSWITANAVFFDRNQGKIPDAAVDLNTWRLSVNGAVKKPLRLSMDRMLRMPRDVVANTLECSGNSRSLLEKKASGNPWTIGGVGNAVWGGVRLREVLEMAQVKSPKGFVAFEGMDQAMGSSGIKFVRSIPLEKAMSGTLLAYEMNGEPLPLKHGYPLRALALGWTGANCTKWLKKITVMEKPYEGFFMDKVYRVFQKGEDPKAGEVVTGINIKSIITQPESGEKVGMGKVVLLGAAYAGESRISSVEVSTDNGRSWHRAEFLGPDEPFAWRQWQYLWEVSEKGQHTLMSRATDTEGLQQPMNAAWNVLGYGNNGVREHAVNVTVV